MDRVSIDDFDWSGSDTTSPAQAVPTSPEPAPPPPPAPPPEQRRSSRVEPDPELLPPSYRDYKRPESKPLAPLKSSSIDDFDWGDAGVSNDAYNPSDDYAITRGIKAGYSGGADAITANLDMARIATLSPEQQVAEMLKEQPVDPSAAKLQVEGVQDIGGVGDVFTFVGESIGQMIGSWSAAAVYGGGTGAATGAAGGAAVGAVAGGVGAAPGALAGGIGGATYGTYAGFVAMGTGGMWRDLLSDEGVRAGLKDGSITPSEVYAWALGGGAVIGALDAIPFAKRAGEVTGTKEVAKDAIKAKLRDVVKRGLIKGAVEEGGTEALQGAISEIGQAIAGGNADVGERVLSVVNQGLAGAFGGAPAGVIGEYSENRRIPVRTEEANDQTPPGTTAPVPPEGGGGGTGGPGTGTGVKPPPPAGAGAPATQPAVTTLPAGGIDPAIAAAAGPDEEFEAEEEGEFDTGPAIPAGKYEKPATKAAVSPAIAEQTVPADIVAAVGATPQATTGQQPAPLSSTNVPTAPAAEPTGQLPPSDIGRTGMSAYMPPGIEGQPPVPGQPIQDASQTEGLPNYGQPEAAEVPEPAAGPPAAAPAPQPAVSMAPPAPPLPVEIAQPDLEAQVGEQAAARQAEAAEAVAPPRESKGERAKRVARERSEAQRQGKIINYAEALEGAPSDIEDGVRYWQKLSGDDRILFQDALKPEVGEAIRRRVSRETIPVAQMAPPRQPREAGVGAEEVARTPEPPKAPARVRPSVRLKLPKPLVRALEPKPATTTRTERMTPEHYRRAVNAQGVAPVHKLIEERGIARNRKTRRKHIIRFAPHKDTGVVEAIVQGAGKKGAALHLTPEEMTAQFDVDITGVTTGGVHPEMKPEPSSLDRFAEKARQHFKRPKAKAVQLPDDLFSPEQVSALEKAGMAEGGTMDAAEFARWDAHRRGITPPSEKVGRPPTAEEREQFRLETEAKAAQPKKPYVPVPPRPRPKTEQEIAEQEPRVEVERKMAERVMGPRAGRYTHGVRPEDRPWMLKTRHKRGVRHHLREAAEAGLRAKLPSDVEEAPVIRAVTGAVGKAMKRATTAAKGEPISQADLYRQYEKALLDAEAAYTTWSRNQTEANEEAAVEAHKKAIRLQREMTVKRAGKISGKEAAAIKAEDRNTTRRAAYREALLAKEHPVGRDKELLKIASYFRQLVSLGKSPKKEGMRNAINKLIDEAQARRIKARQKLDVQQTKLSAAEEERQRKEDKELAAHEARLVEAGLIEPGELESRHQQLKKYRERMRRSRKSGPVLKRLIKDTELPGMATKGVRYEPILDAEGEPELDVNGNPMVRLVHAKFKPPATPREEEKRRKKIGRARYEREQAQLAAKKLPEGNVPTTQLAPRTYREVRDWAKDFVGKAEANLTKAGLKLPDKLSERFNTLEENVVLFVKQMLGKDPSRIPRREDKPELGHITSKEAREQAEIEARKGVGTLGKRFTGKKAGWRERREAQVADVPYSTNRAYNLMEAYTIMQMATAEGRSPLDEKRIYDMMFEETRTKSVALRGQGLSQYASEKAYRQAQQALSMREVEDVGSVRAEEQAPEWDVVRGAEAEETTAEMAERLAEKWGVRIKGLKEYMAAPEGAFDIEKWLDANDSIREEVANIIRQVSGLTKTTFASRIPIEDYAPGWGQKIRDASGAYDFVKDAIEISLTGSDMVGAAYHEAYHRLQNLFLTAQQREIHASEEKRLRDIVAKLPGRAEQAAKMSLREIEAEAFRAHAQGLAKVPGRLMALWSKLTALVRRTKNYLAGRGFQTSEDIFEKAIAGKILRQPKRDIPYMSADRVAYMANPFDSTALANHVNGTWESVKRSATAGWLKEKTLKVLDTETMRRRVAELFFDGNYDNPFSRAVDAHLSHERLVEDAMRTGDRLDDTMRRWEAQDPKRTKQVQHAYETLLEASIDGIDPRSPVPAKADEATKAAHARLKAEWDKVPAELQKMFSDRANHMAYQARLHDETWARQWLKSLMEKPEGAVKLPNFLTFDGAIKQILSGKLSPGFKEKLGKNADTVADIGKLARRTNLYLPAFRAGKYFISGRYNIATPTATHGQVKFDQEIYDKRGIFRFEFTDKRDADAYRKDMASSGAERVVKTQLKHIDPVTGQFLPGQQKIVRDAKGERLRDGVPRYYVVMQDRFMQMSDSQKDLESARAEHLKGGEFKDLSQVAELAEFRSGAQMMPLALQRMLKNIDDMHVIPENASETEIKFATRQKDISKHMITNAFLQTQQGNRLTKKLIRRTGVFGYETSTADMYRSFNSHNEMMSRSVVSIDRIPALRKAMQDLDRLQEALRYPEKRADLTPEERAFVDRNYGKHARSTLQLGSYVNELNSRIEGSMQSRKPGLVSGFSRIMQSLATMVYLGSPAYYAIQMLGIAMQTFPRMASRFGMGRAYNHLLSAYSDLNSGKLMGKGALEGWEEMKQQFAPSDFHKKGLFREGFDFVEQAIANLIANKAANLEIKIKAIRKARELNHIGQAGLDQPNLRLRNIEGGIGHRILANLEQSTRIFRALQEGIETVNRAAPIAAYVDLLLADNPELSENEVIQRAITAMVNEQTGYAKGNWATWMSNPLFQFPLMFKKFAITQAITFYESIGRAVGTNSTPAERRAAIVHLALMAGILGALGGFSGNPLWEPARMLLYLSYLLGISPRTWDETKTQGEKFMADLFSSVGGKGFGQRTAEVLMYGLPRLAGIDVSGRLAMDSLITFNQPEEFTQDEFYTLAGKFAMGAPGAVAYSTGSALAATTDAIVNHGELPPWKTINSLPIPKVLKDIAKGYDQTANGITTATGVDTGAGLNIAEGMATALGFRTRTQARPFEQGSVAKKKIEDRVDAERQKIITRAVNSGLSSSMMREISAWNRDHPDKKQRITVKTIHRAKKRRRETEKDIREANEGVF